MRRAIPCLLMLLTAVPVWAAPSPWAGTWFGTGQPNDKSEMYIDYFVPDGAFHNHHRWCRKGVASDTLETGTWSISGKTLTIRIATVDGQPQPRVDLYKVLSVDAKAQHYAYAPTNFPYTSHRVTDDFKMPGCDLTS